MTIEFILENWYLFLAAAAVGMATGIAVYHFVKQPRTEQLAKVRKWLLLAVIEAEKALGSGTGDLKLRRVYDLFVARFPWLAKVVSFEAFENMVKDALVEMRELLEKNPAVALYLAGDNALILDGIDVDSLDDNQLRSVLQQMGYAYTDGMTREQMLAALDEAAAE